MGQIIDNVTRKPLKNAVVRLFQAEYDKLIESQASDKRGRYGFLAGQGIFYLTINKQGYQGYRTEFIDLREIGKGDFIAENVELRPIERVSG